MRVLRTCTEYGDTHPIAYLLLEHLLEYCTALRAYNVNNQVNSKRAAA